MSGPITTLAEAAAGHVHGEGGAASGSFQSRWDFFTNFGQYMNRTHCVRLADGSPDWPWILTLIILTGGVVASYLKIFVFWRRSYLEVAEGDRNNKLMDLAWVFLLCATCGYAMSIVMFFWPAYRLLAMLLLALNFFSWRFATSLGDFKVSFGARALQRKLADEVRLRNEILERQVSEQTAELRQREAEAQHLALTDPLTRLANRAALLRRLDTCVVAGKNEGHGFALLFLDLDRFKIVNDSLGHQVGDRLLVGISERLRAVVETDRSSACPECREADAFRLGGDEFVLLLAGVTDLTRGPEKIADALLAALAPPFQFDSHQLFAGASIGIVASDISGGSAQAMLRDADTALYEAKSAGKGRWVRFDTPMRAKSQDRLQLETDLRGAVDGGQLFLVYQPIVSIEDGRVESFEALVRWQHPARGLVSPAQFIPIAEDSGLIVPIGMWVLREACRQLAAWQAADAQNAPRSISVNLSRVQLRAPDLIASVRRTLEETGVSPSALHLEITESTMMNDVAGSIRILESLKAIGVKLDMDDFGTGYSSLACLHQFPIDVLKIDRTFVANIDRGRDFMSLVSAISTLARNLGIAVVAEGIETADQLVLLQALDCQYGQGYLFGKPMPANDAAAYRPKRALPETAGV